MSINLTPGTCFRFLLWKTNKIVPKSHNGIAIFIKKCKISHFLNQFYTYLKNNLYLCTAILKKITDNIILPFNNLFKK